MCSKMKETIHSIYHSTPTYCGTVNCYMAVSYLVFTINFTSFVVNYFLPSHWWIGSDQRCLWLCYASTLYTTWKTTITFFSCFKKKKRNTTTATLTKQTIFFFIQQLNFVLSLAVLAVYNRIWYSKDITILARSVMKDL